MKEQNVIVIVNSYDGRVRIKGENGEPPQYRYVCENRLTTVRTSSTTHVGYNLSPIETPNLRSKCNDY